MPGNDIVHIVAATRMNTLSNAELPIPVVCSIYGPMWSVNGDGESPVAFVDDRLIHAFQCWIFVCVLHEGCCVEILE